VPIGSKRPEARTGPGGPGSTRRQKIPSLGAREEGLDHLPADTQEKIRSTTRRKAEPYRTPSGYEFPDTVVTGIAIEG
jgi:hypothetical protein